MRPLPPLLVPFHTLGSPSVRVSSPSMVIIIKDINEEHGKQMRDWFFENYQQHFAPSQLAKPSPGETAQVLGLNGKPLDPLVK